MNIKESPFIKKSMLKAQEIALKANSIASRFTNPADILGASFIGINNALARANPFELVALASFTGLTAASQIKKEKRKEVFLKGTKALGLVTGALMTISNQIIPVLFRVLEKSPEYINYMLRKYPLPPDPVSALNAVWLEEGLNNGLRLLNIPLTGNIKDVILSAGFLGGPVLLMLSSLAKTSFPKKNKV